MFIHDLKKKVGPSKYKKISKKRLQAGNKSKKKEKNKISDTKKIDPGNPKKSRIFSSVNKKSLGHK